MRFTFYIPSKIKKEALDAYYSKFEPMFNNSAPFVVHNFNFKVINFDRNNIGKFINNKDEVKLSMLGDKNELLERIIEFQDKYYTKLPTNIRIKFENRPEYNKPFDIFDSSKVFDSFIEEMRNGNSTFAFNNTLTHKKTYVKSTDIKAHVKELFKKYPKGILISNNT